MHILDVVAHKVKGLLELTGPVLVVLNLTAFDSKLALGRLQLFSFLSDLALIFCLRCLKLCNLIGALLKSLVQHFDILQGVILIIEYSLVPSLQITVSRVHVIKLRFKLETQLDLLLMILGILLKIFLELEPHLPLVHHLTLQLFAHLLLVF